jgi:DNA-binding PadR family transcriptional regulator
VRITRRVGQRREDPGDLEEFGRFAEPALLILVSLADGPKHGYAITEDIAAFADVRFGPGTLYGAIARLESRGLIQALDAEDRRNPYQLTAVGERALRVRLASIQTVARVAQRRLASS